MTDLLRHWFARPSALWLLLVIPLGALFAWRARRKRRLALARMGSGLIYQSMIGRREGILPRLRGFCWVFGLILLVVGVAGPQWGLDWTQSTAPGRDLVVVLDLSRSMLAEKPSRLERAQRALVDLSHVVQERGGHRLGLVIFAGRAKVVCPLTHDYDHFRQMVERYDEEHLDPRIWPREIDVSGTRIGQGVQAATELLDPRFSGAQDILLLSDGDDPVDDREWELAILAGQFAKVPVHCVGIGDSSRATTVPASEGPLKHESDTVMTRLNEEPLKEIAERTQGTYISAGTSTIPLGELFSERIVSGPRRDESSDVLPVYQQRYARFLAVAFGLLLMAVILGQRRFRGA